MPNTGEGRAQHAMIATWLVVWSAWWAAAGGARPLAPAVPRCCRAGHELAADALRAEPLPRAAALAACRAAAAPRAWAPLVYAPARGAFLPRGQLPPHWRLADAAIPACERLRAIPEHSAPYALLANNGSLLLRSAGAALPPDRYCADARAALVCAEDAPWPPSKCCPETRTFDGSACVEEPERAAAALQELRALANGSGVGGGWPACAEGSRYAVAGALAGARLGAEGALQLAQGARLAAGAWCAEAVPAEAGARVLACEGAARAAAGSRAARHVLYGAGLAVGAAFLAATLAAGFALPAAHHALHWRCQTHYVAALMLGDALLAATQLAGDQVPPTLCRALGESRPVRPGRVRSATSAHSASLVPCAAQPSACTSCSYRRSSGSTRCVSTFGGHSGKY